MRVLRNIVAAAFGILVAVSAAAQDFSVIGDLHDDFSDLDTLPRPKKYNTLHMLGVKYSYDLCTVNATPSIGEKLMFSPVNLGVYYTYYHPLWDQLNLFGLQMGAKYGTEGYNSEYSNWGEAVTYIEFPLGAQLKFDFSRFRVLFNIGPYYSYRLKTSKPGGFDEFDIRHSYGIYGGGGFAIVFDPFELQFEGNYKYSLCSMYHTNKYSDLYWLFATPATVSISAGLFIHLW